MPERPFLEVIAASVADAQAAEQAGASRLELVQALSEGGLSPSLGLVAAVRDAVRLPLMVMVRPRGGDFVYAEAEYDVMARDIARVRTLGVDGVVLGALREDGNLDRERVRALVACARPLAVTFHRAFDAVTDQHAALETLVELGIERVLTSGAAASAEAGAHRIASLVRAAGTRIVVMPGAGLRAANAAFVRATTGAKEFHGSCTKLRERDGTRHVDAAEVRAVLAALASPSAT